MPIINDNYWYNLNSWGHVEFEDLEDAAEGYDQCVALIMSQTRWVLDNMDYVKEFEVPWLNYANKQTSRKFGRHYAISHPYYPKEE